MFNENFPKAIAVQVELDKLGSPRKITSSRLSDSLTTRGVSEKEIRQILSAFATPSPEIHIETIINGKHEGTCYIPTTDIPADRTYRHAGEFPVRHLSYVQQR